MRNPRRTAATAAALTVGLGPASVGRVLKLDVTAGDTGGLARGEILVGEEELKDKKLEIGTMLPMTFARTGNRELRIAGTFAENRLLGS